MDAPDSVARPLASGSVEDKVQALRQLAAQGGESLESNAGCVVEHLAHEDTDVQVAAVEALAALAPPPGQALLGQVAQHLTAATVGARCAAAQVLGAWGEVGADHAAAVARLLDDSSVDENVAMLVVACVKARPCPEAQFPKCAAAWALPRLGAKGWAFASAVAQGMQDKNPEVRASAATALGAMGMEGAAHEKAVLALLKMERDPFVVAAAACALATMSVMAGLTEPSGMGDLLKLFASQHPVIRGGAARAIGQLGEGALPHAKHLLKCLTDRSPQVKMAAVAAIANLGVKGQVYAADVGRLACDDWQTASVRVAALGALAAMGERGAAFADDVVQLLNGAEEEEVRAAAESTLLLWGVELW